MAKVNTSPAKDVTIPLNLDAETWKEICQICNRRAKEHKQYAKNWQALGTMSAAGEIRLTKAQRLTQAARQIEAALV